MGRYFRQSQNTEPLDVESLNKAARNRLADLQIEAEDICSLRLGGKLRLYGLLIESVYHFDLLKIALAIPEDVRYTKAVSFGCAI